MKKSNFLISVRESISCDLVTLFIKEEEMIQEGMYERKAISLPLTGHALNLS